MNYSKGALPAGGGSEDGDFLVEDMSRILVERINIQNMLQFNSAKKLEKIYQTIKKIAEEEKIVASDKKLISVAKEIYDEIFEFGPVSSYMKDENITEIMINDFNKIYIEKNGQVTGAGTCFRNRQHVKNLVERLVSPQGLRVDESFPIVDARLDDGSRINAVIGPVSVSGITVTIRKFKNTLLKMEDLIALKTLDAKMSEFLRCCVESKINIFVSGGTSSGKTTFLNILSDYIPEKERIIIIEETPELNLKKENIVKLESRQPNIEGRGEITIRDLVRTSLRMRPDRIMVGEIRGLEAIDVLGAMNTGHEGSMTTIHANSPADLISRLETMIMMSSANLNSEFAKRMILSSANLIVHMERLPDGKRKVRKISEIAIEKKAGSDFCSKDIITKDIFLGNGDNFEFTGHLPEFLIKTGHEKEEFYVQNL
jgi:pilus assembly protein CpaF